MRRSALLLLAVGAFIPFAASAASPCCKCYKGSQTTQNSFCVDATVSTVCGNLTSGPAFTELRSTDASLVSDVTCDAVQLTGSACNTISSTDASALCRVSVAASTDEIRGALNAIARPPAPTGTSASPTQPFTPIDVNLGVSIGGVSQLSGATQNGDVVSVPFLGQYVNLVYRYMVGIVLIAAIVMVVYGGFLYLVGSTTGNVSRGKEIIRDAIVGLVLVLAAYAILNTINPATVIFHPLEFSAIQFDAVLDTTQVDTLDADSEAGPGSGSCPITLSAAATLTSPTEPRSQEFVSRMTGLITGGSKNQQVVRAATAAANCGVHLGSCGRSVEQINGTVGVTGRGHQTHSISSADMLYLDTIKCSDYSRDCARSAKQTAFTRFTSSISNWPDIWLNDLQPGDAVTVFNANSSQFGTHAFIFMGWGSNGNANVVQGSYGQLVRTGTICLKSSCSNPAPVVRTFHPE